MQVLLHRDILSSAAELGPVQRRLLRRRMATSYRRLARLAWGDRRSLDGIGYAVQAAYLAPWPFLHKTFYAMFRKERMPGSNTVRKSSGGHLT
jgi:hypothetical protein